VFLEDVIKSKGDASGEDFSSVDDLCARYKNLRNLNNNLLQKKDNIIQGNDNLSVVEKNRINELNNMLFQQQKKQ